MAGARGGRRNTACDRITGAEGGNKDLTSKLETTNYDIGQSRGGRVMSVIDFFEYLAASDHTVDLAHELADVWVAHQMVDVYQPAA